MTSLTIDVKDDEVQAELKRLASSMPDGVIGRVWSAGANQGGGDYERYVLLDDEQAQVHKGRWKTIGERVPELEPIISGIIADGVRSVMNGASVSALRSAVDEALDRVLENLKDQPAQPGGSRYVRTGTLMASYRKERKL